MSPACTAKTTRGLQAVPLPKYLFNFNLSNLEPIKANLSSSSFSSFEEEARTPRSLSLLSLVAYWRAHREVIAFVYYSAFERGPTAMR